MSVAAGSTPAIPLSPADLRDPAPVRDRLRAAVVDLVPILVLLVAALVVRTATSWPGWVALALVGAALVWAGGQGWGAAAGGQTVGKRLTGLRVIGDDGGAAAPAGAALVHEVLRGVLCLVTLGIAGLSYRWDPAGRERTWWDRLTGTAVVPVAAVGGSDRLDVARWAPVGDGAPGGPGLGVPGPAGWDAGVPGLGVPGPAGWDAGQGRGGWVPGPVPSGNGRQATVAADATVNRRVTPGPAVSGPGAGAVLPGPGAGAVPAGAAPPGPVAPPPRRPRDDPAGPGPTAQPFLAPPLIGDGARGVPGESAAGSGGFAANRSEPLLITGIADTGAPIVSAMPVGPAPGPASVPGPTSAPGPAQAVPPPPAAPAPGSASAPGPASVPGSGGAVTSAAAPRRDWAVHAPAAPSRPGPRHRAAPGPDAAARPVLDPLATVRLPAAEAELVWDTGRHITVTGRVLIGREPAPADGEQADRLLPVSTDSVGVSKTHLQLDVGLDGTFVTDRQSTNGVRLVHPDGSVDRCPPGQPVPVGPGDVLHFGGRHITVAG